MSASPLQIEPIAGALGALAVGIDLSQPLSPERQKELHDAWMEHQVLFFRGQPLSVAQHKDSIAMWDNRCTQHRVVSDNLVERRHMERITIVGDAPF